MITVNFTGGARKIFQTDSLVLENEINSISELITYLISKKPKNSPNFDGKNLLIAVNGIDSSALDGMNTRLKSNDNVNIIPIIHGGSKNQISFTIINHQISLFEIKKSNSNKDYLLSLRKKFPKLQLQAISSKFILDKEHVQKILNISLHKKLKNNLLSEKIETDILLRFSNSTQINYAIKNVGVTEKENFVLIAIGNKTDLKKLYQMISNDLNPLFKNDNSTFLKKYFHISNQTLNSIESKTPLIDLLVEKASILI
tara:strand:- start:10897 stop:11667 length:771 start_codon:yes stop_codon:yes gene_type:complete